MTTLEGNILIEKFMYPNEIIGKYRADMLIYHVSWNELMKVVIAIEERADGEYQNDDGFWKHYWNNESKIKEQQSKLDRECGIWHVASF